MFAKQFVLNQCYFFFFFFLFLLVLFIFFFVAVPLFHWASEWRSKCVYLQIQMIIWQCSLPICYSYYDGCLYISAMCAHTFISFIRIPYLNDYYCYYDFTVFHQVDGMRYEACGINKYSRKISNTYIHIHEQWAMSNTESGAGDVSNTQMLLNSPLKRTEHYQSHTKCKCLNCDVVAVIRIGSIVLMRLLLLL